MSVNMLARVIPRSQRIRKRKHETLTEEDKADENRWVEETKTTAQDVSTDIAILGGLALKANKVLMALTGDGLKMFLQYNLSMDTQAHMQLVTVNQTGDGLDWWKQKAMVMGASPSCGVAERQMQMQMDNTLSEFTKQEQPYMWQEAKECKVTDAFLKHRQSLSNSTNRDQQRLWAGRVYTDDFQVSFIFSAGRVVRLKKAIYYTMGPGGSNLLLAPKTKISTQLSMIGADWLLNYAVGWLPESKRARLQMLVAETLTGEQEVQQYRKMHGLMWWTVGALMMNPSWMNGTSAPLCKGAELDEGPNTWVAKRQLLWKRLQKWQHFLSKVNGRPVAAALVSEVPTLKGNVTPVYQTSDACTEDEDTRVEGIAGVEANRFWCYYMPEDLKGKLHITTLEAMGALGNTMHFGDGHLEGTAIFKEADAMSTVTLQRTERSKSEMLIMVQELHESLESFHKLKATTVPSHLFGEINYLSDLLSRGRMREFQTACEQMGLAPKRVPTKPQFEQFIRKLVQHQSSL
jgi:hypothetical protein